MASTCLAKQFRFQKETYKIFINCSKKQPSLSLLPEPIQQGPNPGEREELHLWLYQAARWASGLYKAFSRAYQRCSIVTTALVLLHEPERDVVSKPGFQLLQQHRYHQTLAPERSCSHHCHPCGSVLRAVVAPKSWSLRQLHYR